MISPILLLLAAMPPPATPSLAVKPLSPLLLQWPPPILFLSGLLHAQQPLGAAPTRWIWYREQSQHSVGGGLLDPAVSDLDRVGRVHLRATLE